MVGIVGETGGVLQLEKRICSCNVEVRVWSSCKCLKYIRKVRVVKVVILGVEAAE